MALTTSTLPTLYQHFTTGGISNGLSANQPHFTLNDRNISIYSGAMHYFRVPPEYWRDRLRKMRAAGLNTVETYVPWNLHEPMDGVYDFGQGGTDWEPFLDIRKFLKTAQEEDLLVIVRPGPFICAEWEFGGLPSWLLRNEGIKLRTSDQTYMKYVSRYFSLLLSILAVFQFTRGGPIVAFQVENEYGSTETKTFQPDRQYLKQLRQLMLDSDIKELLLTSDSPSAHGDRGTLDNLFQTANFARNPRKEFDALKTLQPGKPFMAMEYWTGWFDHWGERHHKRNDSEFEQVLEEILTYPASVNFYMFHGGTSFGFMSGANIENGILQPDVTSYDYDAPLTENGDYTEKYYITKRLLNKFNRLKVRVPEMPAETPTAGYKSIKISELLSYKDLLKQLQFIPNQSTIPMELLPINKNSGQSYGWTVYSTQISTNHNSVIEIRGQLHDSVLILIDNKSILKPVTNISDPGLWLTKNLRLELPSGLSNTTLDIIVHNWGRNNFGPLETFNQFKGLRTGTVFLDGFELNDWNVAPVEFKSDWIKNLRGWRTWTNESDVEIGLYRAHLKLDEEPRDTFVDMTSWNAGIVIVNNFVLGRFFHLGPQQTLYLPAVFLRKGTNEIVVFEQYKAAQFVKFGDKAIHYPIL